jgi:hypothetical protein
VVGETEKVTRKVMKNETKENSEKGKRVRTSVDEVQRARGCEQERNTE